MGKSENDPTQEQNPKLGSWGSFANIDAHFWLSEFNSHTNYETAFEESLIYAEPI